jgi:hypothetical protein
MKRRMISLFASIAMIAVVTNAQNTAKTTFGVRAGINFQNINGKDFNGDKLKNDLTLGFHVGANVEIPFAQDFYLQPGLLFSTKGAKVTEGSVEEKITIGYLELPINFLYKPVLGNGHLLAGFGPYVGYGITGKVKSSEGGQTTEKDIKFKNTLTASDLDADVVYLRALDAGANFLAGYEFSFKLSFQLNAQLGLVKINPGYEGDSEDKSSEKNTGFGFSVGYRF